MGDTNGGASWGGRVLTPSASRKPCGGIRPTATPAVKALPRVTYPPAPPKGDLGWVKADAGTSF